MPGTLRSRLALLAAAAVFFLPALWSSPGGLTNLLTCNQKSQTPFSIVINDKLQPTLTTSLAESAGAGANPTLCGGLLLDLRASATRPGVVTIKVILTNKTPHPWRGTVGLNLGSLVLPLPMGRIGPGETSSASQALHLTPGSHDLEGSLLLGP